jgi:hypothetical protein
MSTITFSTYVINRQHKKTHFSCLSLFYKIIISIYFVNCTKIHSDIKVNRLHGINYSLKLYIEPKYYNNNELSRNNEYIQNILKEKLINNHATEQNILNRETINITVKDLKVYKIFTIEFHRVETPFIIGIWIFFASVAKIGMNIKLLFWAFKLTSYYPKTLYLKQNQSKVYFINILLIFLVIIKNYLNLL